MNKNKIYELLSEGNIEDAMSTLLEELDGPSLDNEAKELENEATEDKPEKQPVEKDNSDVYPEDEHKETEEVKEVVVEDAVTEDILDSNPEAEKAEENFDSPEQIAPKADTEENLPTAAETAEEMDKLLSSTPTDELKDNDSSLAELSEGLQAILNIVESINESAQLAAGPELKEPKELKNEATDEHKPEAAVEGKDNKDIYPEDEHKETEEVKEVVVESASLDEIYDYLDTLEEDAEIDFVIENVLNDEEFDMLMESLDPLNEFLLNRSQRSQARQIGRYQARLAKMNNPEAYKAAKEQYKSNRADFKNERAKYRSGLKDAISNRAAGQSRWEAKKAYKNSDAAKMLKDKQDAAKKGMDDFKNKYSKKAYTKDIKNQLKQKVMQDRIAGMKKNLNLTESTDLELMTWLNENGYESNIDSLITLKLVLEELEIEATEEKTPETMEQNIDNKDIYDEPEHKESDEVEEVVVEAANMYLSLMNMDDDEFDVFVESLDADTLDYCESLLFEDLNSISEASKWFENVKKRRELKKKLNHEEIKDVEDQDLNKTKFNYDKNSYDSKYSNYKTVAHEKMKKALQDAKDKKEADIKSGFTSSKVNKEYRESVKKAKDEYKKLVKSEKAKNKRHRKLAWAKLKVEAGLKESTDFELMTWLNENGYESDVNNLGILKSLLEEVSIDATEEKTPETMEQNLGNENVYPEDDHKEVEEVEEVIFETYNLLMEMGREEFTRLTESMNYDELEYCEYLLSEEFEDILNAEEILNESGFIMLDEAENRKQKRNRRLAMGITGGATAGTATALHYLGKAGKLAGILSKAGKGIATAAKASAPVGAALAAGGLAAYGAKKIYDKVQKEKTITKNLKDKGTTIKATDAEGKDSSIKYGEHKQWKKQQLYNLKKAKKSGSLDKYTYKERKKAMKDSLKKSAKAARRDEADSLYREKHNLTESTDLELMTWLNENGFESNTDNLVTLKIVLEELEIEATEEKTPETMEQNIENEDIYDKPEHREVEDVVEVVVEAAKLCTENGVSATLENITYYAKSLFESESVALNVGKPEEKEYDVDAAIESSEMNGNDEEFESYEDIQGEGSEAAKAEGSEVEPSDIQETVKYTSLREACLLDEGYFTTDSYSIQTADEKQTKLTEQISLLMAREAADPLYDELLKVSIQAQRLQEACIRKYEGAATQKAFAISGRDPRNA